MNLNCILLNQRTQSEKATYRVIPTTTFGKGKTRKTVKRSVVARGLEEDGQVEWGFTQGIFKGGKPILYDTITVIT